MTHPPTDDCSYDEVIVEADDGPLRAGMRVLVPCSCGETPYDEVARLIRDAANLQDAILALSPYRELFHWAPRARRKQIIRYGLRPRMRTTATTGLDGWRAPWTCFADSPSWAWALSGDQPNAPAGDYDLWVTSLDRLVDPIVCESADRPSGMHEVRTRERVFKRDLWLAGTRTK